MKKEKEYLKARQLRSNGESINVIAKILNVSKGSVSAWCKDIILTEAQLIKLKMKKINIQNKGAEYNREKFLQLRKEYQQQGRLIAQKYKNDIQFVIGCALYWAQGNKSRSQFGVSNLDIQLLKKIKNWAIKYFGCLNNKFFIQINAYLNNELSEQQIINYWQTELSISKQNIHKVIAREKYYSGKNRTIKNKYGICQLKYYDVKITQQIFGAIQELMSITEPDWIN